MADKLLILDCGGQYAHLITRKVKELRVNAQLIYPNEKELSIEGVKGIIISGGPASIHDSQVLNKEFLEKALGKVPILGICYGHQWLAHTLGGQVRRSDKKEFGKAKLSVVHPEEHLLGLAEQEDIWMSHGDVVESLPADFSILAKTENCPIAAYASSSRKIYGTQFHPEVVHTKKGDKILKNFVFDICNCDQTWTRKNFIKETVRSIKEKVGDKRAVMYLSGGVDSTITAALASKALEKQLTAIYVNTGLMRKREREEVKTLFQEFFAMDLKIIEAEDKFLEALKGIKEPERKREIIGDLFVSIFKSEAEKIQADFLIQGTIYPDRIESAQSGYHTQRIKSHHNIVGDIDQMRRDGKIIEPLADLYKDEVRELGEELGIPKEWTWRQPFPGPGLAVRIEGDITKKKATIARKANTIVKEEVEKLYIPRHLWQYFAVLTSSKAVGVKGDARSEGYVIVVRIVQSKEAMTANFAKVDWDVLEQISSRITNEIPEVARVTYDITNKPPGTIEWE